MNKEMELADNKTTSSFWGILLIVLRKIKGIQPRPE